MVGDDNDIIIIMGINLTEHVRNKKKEGKKQKNVFELKKIFASATKRIKSKRK